MTFLSLRSFYGVFIRFNWLDFRRTFFRILTNSGIQDGGPSHGRHSEMIMQSLRHVTSSPHDEDFKEDIFRHNIYPPSLDVIGFIFSELRGGTARGRPKKPGLNRVNMEVLSQFDNLAVKSALLYIFVPQQKGHKSRFKKPNNCQHSRSQALWYSWWECYSFIQLRQGMLTIIWILLKSCYSNEKMVLTSKTFFYIYTDMFLGSLVRGYYLRCSLNWRWQELAIRKRPSPV